MERRLVASAAAPSAASHWLQPPNQASSPSGKVKGLSTLFSTNEVTNCSTPGTRYGLPPSVDT